LSVVFGTASLSHLAGVEPILGAFLAGLGLNRLIPQHSTLMNRIRFTGDAIFVPFFLISVGMLVDVRVMAGGLRFWTIATAMLATVLFTKWLAAVFMRPVLGYTRDATGVLFGITIAQAAATLAATMVGHDIGLFDDTVVNATIVMIFGTCILAPFITEGAGARLADQIRDDDRCCPEPRQRIIVALRQPDATPYLMDLALLIRDAGSGQPIHPLIVVEDGERASTHVVQAERLLSDAVVLLSAADVPATPLTRIDLSVPSGILRARREIRATDVIIGWADPSFTLTFLFGTVQENLLTEPGYTLLVSRILSPLNTCRRVLLIIPPGTEREPAFPVTLRRTHRLARQLDAPVTVLTPALHQNAVARRIRVVESRMDVTFHPLPEWSLLIPKLDPFLQETDLIILCGSQTGTQTGQRPYRNLPGKIAQRFPRASLVVIHPAALDDEPSSTPPIESEKGLDATLHYELTHLTGEHLQDAILSILSGFLQILPGVTRDTLHAKLMQDAIELMPGLVMMHAETEMVTTSAVVIGVNRDGLCWPDGTRGVHVLVLLIDPPGRDAGDHLQNLSAVARMFHDPAIIDDIRAAQTIDDIRHTLHPNS
jgi:mannitol/fructose-specific phosphotransferase system IIA component